MLQAGQIAPDFTLPRLNNGASHFYNDDRHSIVVFYKYSCPTCQLALPYIQKIYEAYGNYFHFAAVAQDGPEETKEFVQQYALTLPVLLDQKPYEVSKQYELVSVPSIFLVNPDKTIRYAGEGFSKQDLFNLADVLAEKSATPQIELFGNEDVPDFKPG